MRGATKFSLSAQEFWSILNQTFKKFNQFYNFLCFSIPILSQSDHFKDTVIEASIYIRIVPNANMQRAFMVDIFWKASAYEKNLEQ